MSPLGLVGGQPGGVPNASTGVPGVPRCHRCAQVNSVIAVQVSGVMRNLAYEAPTGSSLRPLFTLGKAHAAPTNDGLRR
jgi:hypothetical protein